jgi:hypothetical protein
MAAIVARSRSHLEVYFCIWGLLMWWLAVRRVFTGRSWAVLGDGDPAARTSELCYISLYMRALFKVLPNQLGEPIGLQVGHPAREINTRQSHQ